MTTGVDQSLPRMLMPKAGPDRQSMRAVEGDNDFGKALGVGAKQRPSGDAGESAGDHPLWLRFGTKLNASINTASGLGSKLDPDSVEADSSTEQVPEMEDNAKADKQELKSRKSERKEDENPVETIRSKATTDTENTTDAEDADVAKEPDREDLPTGQSAFIPAPNQQVTRNAEPGKSVRNGFQTGETGDIDPESLVDDDQRSADASPELRTKRTAGATERSAPPPLELQDKEAALRSGKQAGAEPTKGPVEKPDPKVARNLIDQPKAIARATIVSEQNFPAPVQSTSVALANSLASSAALKFEPGRPFVDAVRAPVLTSAAQSLSLQLHPAELGMVTATLKFVGQQLTIELQVENNEAYRTLVTDTDTLVKSLRGMGYDIDKVTLLQPVAANSTQARSENAVPDGTHFGRNSEQSGSGATGSGDTGQGNRQPAGNGSNATHVNQSSNSGNTDRPDGGMYI